jgi:carbon monoxide dehydrogenase subunit G
MKLTHKINKPACLVFDYLSNMQKFVTVHPVITKIDDKGKGNYLVHETLGLGFIPISFTYPVTVEGKQQEKIVNIYATVMRFTKIEMLFVIKSEKDFTLVEESINFKSILPIKSIMQGVFKKQHTQLFKNIDMLK